MCWCLVGAPFVEAQTAAPVPVARASELLSHLHREHPRLMLTRDKISQLKAQMAVDPQIKAWFQAIRADGQKILAESPSTYNDFAHDRGHATTRIRTLAFLYLMEGDRAYADRAWKELDAAAHWPDWHASIQLDVSEMILGFALGYDWCYDAWTPEQRTALRQMIITRGLNPAIANHWWGSIHHNWNAVANGGVGVGALAVADDSPEVATKALDIVLTCVQPAMEAYGPDGGWEEGYNYWDYATTYIAFLIDSLQTATGSDGGLSKFPGFSQTGFFPIELNGPSDLAFNFSDAPSGGADSSALFWLAREFHNPAFEQYEKKRAAPTVMNLIWYSPELAAAPAADPPARVFYRSIQVLCLRTAWHDRKATFVGFKGGFPEANHRHIDEGSFVFDVNGYRFARLAGAEDYGKPGYFDEKKGRWIYYRARAEGANTLVINPGPGPDQEPDAGAPLTKVNLEGDRPFAIADLSKTYGKDASAVHRGIALIGGRQLLVQDEIQAAKPADVWWFMHTKAQLEPAAPGSDGRTVILAGAVQGQPAPVRLKAQILSPADARFEMLPAAPLPETNPTSAQSSNPDVRKLTIHLKNVTNSTITVTLTPVMPETSSFATPEVVPLARW